MTKTQTGCQNKNLGPSKYTQKHKTKVNLKREKYHKSWWMLQAPAN